MTDTGILMQVVDSYSYRGDQGEHCLWTEAARITGLWGAESLSLRAVENTIFCILICEKNLKHDHANWDSGRCINSAENENTRFNLNQRI